MNCRDDHELGGFVEMIYRVLFHLDEIEKAPLVFGNIRNVLADLGEGEVEAELVANFEGAKALLKTGPNADRVKTLAGKGVRFAVCANTLRGMDLGEDDFPEPVEIVSSGMGELVRRQAEGWAYIKP